MDTLAVNNRMSQPPTIEYVLFRFCLARLLIRFSTVCLNYAVKFLNIARMCKRPPPPPPIVATATRNSWLSPASWELRVKSWGVCGGQPCLCGFISSIHVVQVTPIYCLPFASQWIRWSPHLNHLNCSLTTAGWVSSIIPPSSSGPNQCHFFHFPGKSVNWSWLNKWKTNPDMSLHLGNIRDTFKIK